MLRRFIAISAAIALLAPVVAQARVVAPRMQDGRVPSAQVQTEGSGVITLAGRMVVNGSIPDAGRVVVTDRGGDAHAYLDGEELRFNARGRAVVRRASGILYAWGSNVQVQVLGSELKFAGAGNGRARFIGQGEYRLNGGDEHAWTGTWIKVAPPRRGERRRRG